LLFSFFLNKPIYPPIIAPIAPNAAPTAPTTAPTTATPTAPPTNAAPPYELAETPAVDSQMPPEYNIGVPVSR